MASTDGFKFWDSYYDALKMLGDDSRRGAFVMALCAFVFDGAEPAFDDPVMEFGFRLVAEQARQSMEISRAAREAGQRGGRPRKDDSKRGAFSTPKSTPKRVAKRVVERGAESVSELVGTSVPTTNSVSCCDDGPAAGADAPPPPIQ